MLTTGARPVNPIVAMLSVRTKGNGSSVPIAISRAIRLAFKHPSVKRKSPTYIEMSVTLLARLVLDDATSATLQ